MHHDTEMSFFPDEIEITKLSDDKMPGSAVIVVVSKYLVGKSPHSKYGPFAASLYRR